jgi:hypothetical protein
MYKLKKILNEQVDPRAKAADMSLAKQLAKRIYDAKGTFVDNETEAVAAIKAIPNQRIFNLTQKELQQLTGGRGIGQYIASFIGHLEDADTKGLGVYATGKTEGQRTVPMLDSMIKHLTKIGANRNTIKIFSNLKTNLTSQYLTNIWEMPETMHNINIIGSIVTLLYGPVGLALSSAYQFNDAKQYYDEGNNYEAGLAILFALIPGGAKLAKGLIKKIVTKSGVLSKAERELLKRAAQSKNAIKSKITDMTANGIKSGKINPYALKSIKWINPVANGVFNVGGNIIKYAAVPMAGYDAAWSAANPNVTELEMQIELDAEEQLFKKQVDALFNKALTDKKRGITYLKGQKDPILIRPESVESTKLQDILTNTTNNKPLQLEAMATPDELEGNTETGENHSLLPKIVFWGGVAIALLVGKGALNIRRKLLGTSAGSKYTIRQQWQMFRDRRRINKIMKSNNVKGLTRSKYRSLLRSITSESRDNIQKLIQDVQRGIYTPEQAVREFQNVYPGEVTDKYLQLIRRRFDEIIPETPTTPVNTDYKRRNIGFQQRGSNIPKDWKYPNVTPDQFNRLSLNQKIALQQNTNLSWSSLQRTR